MAEEIYVKLTGVLLLLYMWFVIQSATPPSKKMQHYFVRHPQRCPNIKTILCQHAYASRLLPVGSINVQLMMYLLLAQVKL